MRTISRRDFFKLSSSMALGIACISNLGCTSSFSNKANDLKNEYLSGSKSVKRVIDSCGREVFLPVQIDKISPTGAYAQILLATLCPDKLVSLSSNYSKSQLKYLDSRFSELPVLGRLYGQNGDLNYENLIKISPDVVIDVGEKKDSIENDMNVLQEKSGLPSLFIECTQNKFIEAYEMLGQILSVDLRAKKLSAYIQTTLDFANKNKEIIKSRNLNVIYSTGERGYEVKIQGSLHAAVLDAVGVNNLAVIEDSSETEVSPEKMMEWNPGYVLLSPEDGFFEEIYNDKVWSGISAVQNSHVYEVPTGPYEWLDRPPSIQQTLGIKWLGNLLAPDIYSFDIKGEVKDFYELFWNCELTDEQVDAFLSNSSYLI